MKKWYKYICLVILAAVCVIACKREEEDPIPVPPSYEVSAENVIASYKYVDIRWAVNTTVTIKEMWIEYTTDPSFEKFDQKAVTVEVDSKTGETNCNVELVDLTENTLYYARFRASNKTGSTVLNTFTFKTKAYEVPQIRLDSITELGETWCKVHATLTDWGMDSIPTEVGFCFADHKDVTVEDTMIVAWENPEPEWAFYWTVLQYLKDNSTYYVRAYAKNTKGVGYSEEHSFTTREIVPPTLGAITFTNVSYTTATVNCEIEANGGAGISETGIYYSIDTDPVKNGTKVKVSYGFQPFSYDLTELTSNMTYHVCSYAINDRGTSYSKVVSFTTVAYGMPTVNTGDVTDITTNGATAAGKVLEDGGDKVTERGICYGLQPNPSLSDTHVFASTSGLGYYTCQLTGLSEGSTYHYRAYATNSTGTTYGEDKTFTTTTLLPPTVLTLQPYDVDYTYAQCGGNVTSSGGLDVLERGVCYATTTQPTIYNMKKSDGAGGVGEYNIFLGELQPGTTYYVRAYAINEKGVGYGEEQTFTTRAYALPIVTTGDDPAVDVSSAICCGQISYDTPEKPIMEFGICYSSSNQNPTTSDNKVTKDDNIYQSYCCVITELQPGTTYYVRAYATTEIGTSYGKSVVIETEASPLPVLTTGKVTNITPSSASCSGNVINQGSSVVLERGICYSTSTNPTINDNVIAKGNGLGSFAVNMTKLTHETTYYIRAYAKNSQGVGYGNEVSFTTTPYYDYNTSKIKYSAISKLPEVTEITQGGLHINAFDGPVLAHSFENGVGYITLGGHITSIGENAFRGSTYMTALDSIPNTVTYIGNNAFYGCSSMTDVDLQAPITVIGSYAFSGCTSLHDINLPWNLTAINEGAFYDCTGLKLITMWDNVTSIGDEAFYNCKNASPISIGVGVTSIGSKAFYKCSGTVFFTVKPQNPPSCASDAFDDFSIPLYVPKGSVDAYKTADVWKNFTQIIAHPNL